MTTKVVPGMLVAGENAAEVATEAAGRMARVLAKALGQKKRVAIALSGGSTPRAAYGELARAEGIDWSRVDVFFVDERAGDPESDRSNYRMIREALLGPARIADENVARMPGDVQDLATAARAYQAEIERRVAKKGDLPAFDLVVFGIGADGHTASLFPGEGTVLIRDRPVVDVPARPGTRRASPSPRRSSSTPRTPSSSPWQEKHGALERAVGRPRRSRRDAGAPHSRGSRSIVWVIDRAAGAG
ncbi:MAG: 6-phosphogluconolactonase [Polyangiaceae bacterium]